MPKRSPRADPVEAAPLGAQPAADERARPTLRTLVAAYTEDYALYHKSTRSLEGLQLFVRAFGDHPVDALSATLIDSWRKARRRQGVSPVTINRNVAALRGALGYAVTTGVLAEQPLRRLKQLPVDDDPRVRYLSDAEEARLRGALAARDARLKQARIAANAWRRARGYAPRPPLDAARYADYLTPAVLVALNTGLRRGELLALRWPDVSETHLTVRAASAKSRRTRHIPLNAEARAVLAGWRARTGARGPVFTTAHGQPLKSLRTAWANLLQAAGITAFRWHDLRHHFASRLVMAGVPLNTVRELLGHAELKMTLRYAHLAPAHLRDAVEAIGAPTADAPGARSIEREGDDEA